MRAGKLDKTITIDRAATTVDEYGAPTEGWTTITTVRAQLIQSTTEEFIQSFGSSSKVAVIFRIRHRDGIAVSDRLTHSGQAYDLKEIKELGRRDGLDLRCTAQGTGN
ncbi:phage head closure protein [Pararhizobium qamdonense]|uniref:phage head closure protein n=1 Tax=Pararhizobium qamdonense TaxID=3031126 RepID=UPI0023E34301|nr:phage head closure protein [Pararhizobium qamdonense]